MGTRDIKEDRLWERAVAQIAARRTATGNSKGGKQRQLREKERGVLVLTV